LLKNLYAVTLVPDGPDAPDMSNVPDVPGGSPSGLNGLRWVVRTMRIDNVWFTGDPQAVFGG